MNVMSLKTLNLKNENTVYLNLISIIDKFTNIQKS